MIGRRDAQWHVPHERLPSGQAPVALGTVRLARGNPWFPRGPPPFRSDPVARNLASRPAKPASGRNARMTRNADFDGRG
jgi:hypothetical protein